MNRMSADPSRSLRRDVGVVVVVTVAMGWLCVRFELYEAVFEATRRWEFLQLDELPAILAVLAIALMWFAWRRYREASEEVQQRRAAEARLAELLRENRRLGQQYIHAQEAERKRLARELHDEAGQYLNAIKTDAVGIQSRSENGPELLRRAAAGIVDHTDRAYEAVRNLIRELRPVGLDELGLKAALEYHIDQTQQRFPHLSFNVSIDDDVDTLSEGVSLALYRLMQEGLTNVARHSQATRVDLAIRKAQRGDIHEVSFTLTDDGVGVDLNAQHVGVGLIGMRERVDMFGGRLELGSAPGAGFRVHARIPVTQKAQS